MHKTTLVLINKLKIECNIWIICKTARVKRVVGTANKTIKGTTNKIKNLLKRKPHLLIVLKKLACYTTSYLPLITLLQ